MPSDVRVSFACFGWLDGAMESRVIIIERACNLHWINTEHPLIIASTKWYDYESLSIQRCADSRFLFAALPWRLVAAVAHLML